MLASQVDLKEVEMRAEGPQVLGGGQLHLAETVAVVIVANPVVQKEERGMVEMLVAAAVVLVDGATGVVEMAQTTQVMAVAVVAVVDIMEAEVVELVATVTAVAVVLPILDQE